MTLADRAQVGFSSADDYDRFMGRWSRQLAPRFLAFAGIDAVSQVLDVACGTGSLCERIAAAHPIARVTGIDLCAPFVEVCRSKFAAAGFEFLVADANDLPFADGSFGAALSALALMLIEAPLAAAREMRRVTRTGGVVAACTWEAGSVDMIQGVWEEVEKLDPLAPLPKRQQRCGCSGELTKLWDEAGLVATVETRLPMTMRFESFDDFWMPLAAGVGPLGSYIGSASALVRKELCARLRRRWWGQSVDRPVSLQACALAVRGSVP